jgi:hypothetical protein
MLDGTELRCEFISRMPTVTLDDVNNRRIRQLIEQFNAEEAYDADAHAAIAQLRELVAKAATLEELLGALRKSRWKFPKLLPVDAVGMWV